MNLTEVPVAVEEVVLGSPAPPRPSDPAALRAALGDAVRHVYVVGDVAAAWAQSLRALLPTARWSYADDPGSPSERIDCDLVLLGDALARLSDARPLLRRLHDATCAEARLLLTVPNQGHVSLVASLLAGESAAPAGETSLYCGPAAAIGSCFKLLLDCGWLPNLHEEAAPAPPHPMLGPLLDAARGIGIPALPAQRTLLARQPLVDCTKHRSSTNAPASGRAFTVIVAVNNDDQFERNIGQSPGLREVGAQVLIARGAPSAAVAFESARDRALHDWIVYCHQDVYFPAGSGHAICRALYGIEEPRARQALIGFAGVGLDSQGQLAKCGLVIDRRTRLDFGDGSRQAISIDEFAIALHRGCPFRINATLGWHLWATDLCLQALRAQADPPPAIVQIPLFHNSYTGYQLPPAFQHSAQILRSANLDLKLIPTLCGAIQ